MASRRLLFFVASAVFVITTHQQYPPSPVPPREQIDDHPPSEWAPFLPYRFCCNQFCFCVFFVFAFHRYSNCIYVQTPARNISEAPFAFKYAPTAMPSPPGSALLVRSTKLSASLAHVHSRLLHLSNASYGIVEYYPTAEQCGELCRRGKPSGNEVVGTKEDALICPLQGVRYPHDCLRSADGNLMRYEER